METYTSKDEWLFVQGAGFVVAADPSGSLPDSERHNDKVAALMLDGSARIMNARVDFQANSKWFIVGDR